MFNDIKDEHLLLIFNELKGKKDQGRNYINFEEFNNAIKKLKIAPYKKKGVN